jgi:23S rRNA (adenine2030-N6)-methyltransferase
MLSYQHGFHAGNFADVHKHSLLSLVLQSLLQKDKPFIGFDLYAGRGRYTLSGSQAQKTGEYIHGIGKLWPNESRIPWPDALNHYRQTLQLLNHNNVLQFYPGSPTLIHSALRDNDQLQVCELHPAELDALKSWQPHHPKAQIHERNAHEALSALLPPKIKRGVVLIDPSYDIKNEYLDVAHSVIEATKKWPQGIYMIWYPLLAAERHEEMIKRLLQRCKLPMLRSELQIRHNNPEGEYGGGMYGSGMLIINPPWQIDNQIKTISPWLEQLCEENIESISDEKIIGSRLIWLREAE